MSAFLWYHLVVGIIAIVARLIVISNSAYPRIVRWKRSEDAWALFFSLGFWLWAAWLLFVEKGGAV